MLQDEAADDAADPFAKQDRQAESKLAAMARAFEEKYVSDVLLHVRMYVTLLSRRSGIPARVC